MGLPVWPAWPGAQCPNDLLVDGPLAVGGYSSTRSFRVRSVRPGPFGKLPCCEEEPWRLGPSESRHETRCWPTSPPPEAYGRAYGFELSMDNPGVIGGLAAWMVIALMLSSASARDQSR
jgi:hypothetical protein